MSTHELMSSSEIVASVVDKIDEKRKLLGYTHKDLATLSGVSKKTYENFIYNHKISFESFIMIIKALKLNSILTELLKENEPQDDEEYKKLNKIREKKHSKIYYICNTNQDNLKKDIIKTLINFDDFKNFSK
jgi:transcriptional regulator with XRE-family HTH domain